MKTEQRVISRVIKFRAWDAHNKEMIDPYCELKEHNQFWGEDLTNTHYVSPVAVMQFTGKHCFNNREVYEGDILFYEQQEDGGDVRYYLVVAWIEEWSMFATLHRSEYNMYLISGAEALDEGLFWTYTLEGCKDYHYAGNIHENPELLND